MGSIYKPKYTDRHGQRQKSAVWWIQYYRNGKPMRESSGSEKESDAKRLLKLREGDIAKGVAVSPRLGRVTFGELAQDLVNEYQVNGRRSLVELKIRLNKHLLPFFGGQRAAAITTADVRTFVATRQEGGASNGEINRELAALKRALSLAIQAGKLMMRPHIPMLKENNVRTGFFKREQFESVRKYLQEPLQSMVTFAYITGWRIPSEVLTLQLRQLDFEAGRVSLDPGTTKNDTGRVFPFTEELRALLEAQKAKTEALQRELGIVCPWVFHRAGKPIKNFRGAWKTACENAGLPGRIPHDFRRTAVRNLVRAGIPERVAMQMTGHKTRAIFERYNIVSEGDLADAARRLDEVTGKDTGKDGHSGGRIKLLKKR